MSDPANAGQPPREEPSDDKQLIDELIFKQDLNEVHLLIDFVSGRADRSLATLTMPNPSKPGVTMTSGEIVEAVTHMRYPPKGGESVNAANAAILLMAKDRLSVLAAPARGLTIAYTTMFIDAESGRSPWARLCRRLKNLFRRRGNAEGGAPAPPATASDNATAVARRGAHHDTRVDLAQRTFPGLEAHARNFHWWRDLLAWFTIFWLFLTALAYWDAGLGRATLERLDQDWKNVLAELKDNPALLRCSQGMPPETPPQAGVEPKANDEAIQREFACRKYNYLRWMGETAGTEVRRVFRCEGMWLSRLVHVWCWHWLLSGNVAKPDSANVAKPDAPKNNQPPMEQTGNRKPGATAEEAGGDHKTGPAPAGYSSQQVAADLKENATYWQTATSLLSVFTTYVLPIMFALLGTLIGAFRAILNRIGASELAPRDLVRMKIGIPTGLVAGIAVGLFLSPSSVAVQGTGGVASQMTLTASGLGFIAGYASQSFFRFLDNMLGTIFPDGSTASAPSTQAQTGNRP